MANLSSSNATDFLSKKRLQGAKKRKAVEIQDDYIEKYMNKRVALKDGGYQMKDPDVFKPHTSFLYRYQPKTSPPANVFTSTNSFEFEITSLPDLHSEDNNCLFLKIPVIETSLTNGVTPAFVENWFDEQKAIEFMIDGQTRFQYGTQQILTEFMMKLTSTEYDSICKALNHDAYQTYNSAPLIGGGGSAVYLLRIPNPLPRTGFYWGALHDHKIKIRFNTVNAVVGGTGTLAYNSAGAGLELLLDARTVHPLLQPSYAKMFEKFRWETTLYQWNNPSTQIALLSQGKTPGQKLDNFQDKRFHTLMATLRQSRSLTPSNAALNYLAPSNGAKLYILDESGRVLFQSTYESYLYQKYIRSVKHFADSNWLQNKPFLMTYIDEDTQGRLFGATDDAGGWSFNGNEQWVIEDSGLTQTVWIEVYGMYEVTVEMDRGDIHIVN